MKTASLEVFVESWLREAGVVTVESCRLHPISLGKGSEISLVRAVRSGSTPREFVLRRIVNEDWLRREGNLIEREATALSLIRDSPIATPRVVAIDPSGKWTGCPALLMTRIEGEPWVESRQVTAQVLSHLANILRQLHDAEYGSGLNRLPPYRPHHWRSARTVDPPVWTALRQVWDRAAAVTFAWDETASPRRQQRLLHRDYRLGNTLWFVGRLSGVVDWVTACRGDAGADIGHCRWNLCRVYGQEAVSAFSRFYGLHDYNPIWDVLAAVGGHPDTPPIDLNEAARLDDFVSSAVSAMG